MQKLIVPLTVLFLFSLTTQILSQEDDFFRKRIEYSVPEKIEGPVSSPLQAGTYSVGTVGYFPTLDSAFNKLSIDGIEGNVVLELVDEVYTATSDTFGFLLDGPIPGSGPGSQVTIRPALYKNVTIEGKGEAVLNFRNISYLTIDGISLTGSTTLKIHSNKNTNRPWNDGISFLNNSKHNVVQNVNVECDDYSRTAGGIVFLHQYGNFMPDSNLIQNNFIQKAAMGICVSSLFYRATGNIIRGNKIGTETDSLISIGINIILGQYTIVENNIIQNIRSNPLLPYCAGIVSVNGTGDKIRNNVVHNVYVNDSNYCGMGILLNGSSDNSGIINSVYNNMIYDIQSTSPQTNASVSGIELRKQCYAKVYFNSVFLSGSGTNQKGSASLNIGINCSNVQVKNNLLVNVRNESPYCASAINCNSSSCLISNYNDLYVESNQCNFIVHAGSVNYTSLSEWQLTGQDLNSMVELPYFVEPYLHIDKNVATILESRGTPIGGFTYDFDDQLRNTVTPDIGADEFNGIQPPSDVKDETIIASEFTLEQNYPNPFNPSTTIRYSIPSVIANEVKQSQLVILKVYDILGNEVVTLVNEEKPAGNYEVNFDANGLSSGVYIYSIQAANYFESRKMVLLK